MSTAARPLPTFGEFAAGGGMFLWVNTSGRPCPGPMGGCEERGDVRRTLAEWVALGLPRTGWSFCRHRCHCVLLPLLQFGLAVEESLGQFGAAEVRPEDSILPPRVYDPLRTFQEQTPLGPDELERAVLGLPLVGAMREEAESIMRAFREGRIDGTQARILLDELLYGRAS